ncbi:MAG: arginase family protein [Candidatus Acidiferrales bacterium]
MAARIIRQTNKLAILGAPTSAAALAPGSERAPAALRAAGLVDRLASLGYEVADLSDDPVQISRPDEESPRARNLSGVIAALEALKPRVEVALKSGALPVILSGDCSVALAVVAGVRRYYRGAGIVYIDRDADLNVPATSASGCVDGMVVSHLAGRGASELVRFWAEPPLVREPEIALFGVDRFDPPEEEALGRSPIRHYTASAIQRMGIGAASKEAFERIHADRQEFVLHFDVDVIDGFTATNFPGTGGLSLQQVREALEFFACQPHLAAIEITSYNPERDSDASAANVIIELMASALAARRQALAPEARPAAPASTAKTESPVDAPASAAAGAAEAPASAAPGAEASPVSDSGENHAPNDLLSNSSSGNA